MAAPVFGKTNKVTVGQEFFSLPVLAARISKLESQLAEQNQTDHASFEEMNNELDGLVKSIADLVKKLDQHIKFGHSNNKPQEQKIK